MLSPTTRHAAPQSGSTAPLHARCSGAEWTPGSVGGARAGGRILFDDGVTRVSAAEPAAASANAAETGGSAGVEDSGGNLRSIIRSINESYQGLLSHQKQQSAASAGRGGDDGAQGPTSTAGAPSQAPLQSTDPSLDSTLEDLRRNMRKLRELDDRESVNLLGLAGERADTRDAAHPQECKSASGASGATDSGNLSGQPREGGKDSNYQWKENFPPEQWADQLRETRS